MAENGISIRFEGLEAAQAAMRRLIQRGDSLAQPLDEIGASLVVATQARFERHAGPDGQSWPPLSKRTLKRRGSNAQPLRKSNHLFQSITHRVEGNTVVVGTNVVYAAIHQFGGEIEQHARSQAARWVSRGKNKGRFAKRGGRSGHVTIGAHKVHIPARPFLGIDQADQDAAVRTLLGYLGEAE